MKCISVPNADKVESVSQIPQIVWTSSMNGSKVISFSVGGLKITMCNTFIAFFWPFDMLPGIMCIILVKWQGCQVATSPHHKLIFQLCAN